MYFTRYLNKENGIRLLILILTILITSIIIMSLVPPVSKDALVHHLAIPKLYLNHGGIYEIPFMEFSYYPMNLDLLYMIPLYFGNDILPKLIHFSFALLTAWMIYNYLKKRTGLIYGLYGAVFFISTPIILKLSINVYVDLGVIFFSFASLLLMMKWLEGGYRIRYLIYSGIMCGLALGTKYNGLLTFVLLAMFIPFLYSKTSRNKKHLTARSLFYFTGFIFIALIIFSPWMIRNYCWKNNPIYPLYNNLFNPSISVDKYDRVESEEEKVKQNRGFFTYRNNIYGESSLDIALLPVRIFFQGKDGDPQYFDGKLNPFLLIFSILAFLPLKNIPVTLKRDKMIFLIFSLLFFLIAFFTAVLRIRYISPIIPPLTVLSILGIKNLLEAIKSRFPRILKTAGIVFVLLLFIFPLVLNVVYLLELYGKVDPLPFVIGKINRDEYISKYIPEYPSLKFINKNTDKNSRIFFIYLGKRGYYCNRDYEFNLGFLHNLILTSRAPSDMFTAFQKKGITHLLISHPVFNRWILNNCTIEKQELLNAFFREFTLLAFYKNGIEFYELKRRDY